MKQGHVRQLGGQNRLFVDVEWQTHGYADKHACKAREVNMC